MGDVTAICQNPKCGIAFNVKNMFGGDPGGQVTLQNIGVGQCPKCGDFGRILDATYQLDKNGITKILSSSIYNADGFKDALSNIKFEGDPLSTVISKINKITSLRNYFN